LKTSFLGRLAAALSAALIGIALAGTRPALAQTHVPCPVLSAQSTAEYQTGGTYGGNWRYTITLSWDVGRHDPSHVDILIGLTNCICVCDTRLFKFGTPAGSSTGLNASGACLVPYAGSFICKGDPSIKGVTTGPALKFQPDESVCSTDELGTGTYIFYSPLPPGVPEVYPDAIAIKHGLDTCYGAIVGVLPICDCSVPTNAATWGQVKSVYR
jgi:hypothetical protein